MRLTWPSATQNASRPRKLSLCWQPLNFSRQYRSLPLNTNYKWLIMHCFKCYLLSWRLVWSTVNRWRQHAHGQCAVLVLDRTLHRSHGNTLQFADSHVLIPCCANRGIRQCIEQECQTFCMTFRCVAIAYLFYLSYVDIFAVPNPQLITLHHDL